MTTATSSTSTPSGRFVSSAGRTHSVVPPEPAITTAFSSGSPDTVWRRSARPTTCAAAGGASPTVSAARRCGRRDQRGQGSAPNSIRRSYGVAGHAAIGRGSSRSAAGAETTGSKTVSSLPTHAVFPNRRPSSPRARRRTARRAATVSGTLPVDEGRPGLWRCPRPTSSMSGGVAGPGQGRLRTRRSRARGAATARSRTSSSALVGRVLPTFRR